MTGCFSNYELPINLSLAALQQLKLVAGKFTSLATVKLWHKFKVLPLVAQVQLSLAPLNVYNVLPKGLKAPLMRLTYGLQVPDSFIERITSFFQGLNLIFEAFDCDYITICAFSVVD